MERFYFGQVCLVPGDFLFLNGQLFLEIWEVFCYYFFEFIMYPFGLHLFSFFDAQDSQVWSFYEIAEFLHIHLQLLNLLS
jgi:hypothetical protein